VRETVAEGNLVATHISMTGGFERPLVQANGMTVEPNGVAIDIAGIEFYSFDDDGMIALSWPEFDVLDFLQQIGVIPTAAAGSPT
jgi:SnoaL-like polyketide cyclase